MLLLLDQAKRQQRHEDGILRSEARSYYVQAVKNEMKALESHKSACAAAKQPDKCAKAVSKKIEKTRKKLQKTITKKKPY